MSGVERIKEVRVRLAESTLKDIYKIYLDENKDKEREEDLRGWHGRAVQTALEFYIEHHKTPNKQKHSPLFELLNE